jgi:O-antigen biosynthesis protein
VIKYDISIIIVNYNVRDLLIDCIDSVLKSLQNFSAEIIVVDNNSTDDSVEVLKKVYPNVKLIISKENQGFAKANNIALKQAEGKFIFLLNPDTLLSENAIPVFMDYFSKNPAASIAGCKLFNSNGTLQVACRRSFPTPWNSLTKLSGLSKLFPNTKLFGGYNVTYLNPEETYQVEAISGACMFFRREVYDDIGGLDESFFMYGEDLDWLFRASKRGWKTFYLPQARVLHYKGESTRRSDINAADNFYGAMHLFVKKHYNSSLLIFILRFGIFCKYALSFITDRISHPKNRNERNRSRSIIVFNSELEKGELLLPGKNDVLLGYVITAQNAVKGIQSGSQVLGNIEELDSLIKKHDIDKVIFSPVSLSYDEIINTIVKSKSKHITFCMVPRPV